MTLNILFKRLYSAVTISPAVFQEWWWLYTFVVNEENQGKCHGGLTSTQTTQQD